MARVRNFSMSMVSEVLFCLLVCFFACIPGFITICLSLFAFNQSTGSHRTPPSGHSHPISSGNRRAPQLGIHPWRRKPEKKNTAVWSACGLPNRLWRHVPIDLPLSSPQLAQETASTAQHVRTPTHGPSECKSMFSLHLRCRHILAVVGIVPPP